MFFYAFKKNNFLLLLQRNKILYKSIICVQIHFLMKEKNLIIISFLVIFA